MFLCILLAVFDCTLSNCNCLGKVQPSGIHGNTAVEAGGASCYGHGSIRGRGRGGGGNS